MEKIRHGGGRVLYWAHVAGPTERRSSVRPGNTAFELMPTTTPNEPYSNILLIDLATHPRLIPSATLQAMLGPGIYLTEVARHSLPGIEEDHVQEVETTIGEKVWAVLDTAAAFHSYLTEETASDTTHEALEGQHRRIRALSEGRRSLPINAFPVPRETVLALLDRHMVTLGDLVDLDLHGVRMQSDLRPEEIVHAYQVIRSTLEARHIETT